MSSEQRAPVSRQEHPAAAPLGTSAALGITLGCHMIASIGVVALPALAPPVASALGISPAYIGPYMTLLFAASMTSGLLGGGAALKYGTIRVTQVCLLLCAAGLACCALPWIAAVACGGFLIGLGAGPMGSASTHLLASATPAHRMSLVFSVRQTAGPLGGVLAGSVLPALNGVGGWQLALLVLAGVTLLAAAAAQPVRVRCDADRDRTRRLGWGDFLEPVQLVLSVKPLRQLAVSSFVFCLSQVALTAYLVVYLTDSLAYGLATAGVLLSVSQAAALGGRIFWGYAADTWFGAQRMLAILGVLMTLAMLATAMLQPGTPLALVAFVLVVLGASAMGWNGIQLAEANRHAPPGKAGQATAGVFFFSFVALVLGPLVFAGLLGLTGSYRAGFLSIVIPLALVTVGLWRQTR